MVIISAERKNLSVFKMFRTSYVELLVYDTYIQYIKNHECNKMCTRYVDNMAQIYKKKSFIFSRNCLKTEMFCRNYYRKTTTPTMIQNHLRDNADCIM